MRLRLARAAFEVIAERGHSAYRTAAVAERAGVSQGAQIHHFATKDGLTLAAVEHAFAHASATTEEIIAEGLAAGDDVLDLMLGDFRLYFFNDDFWVSLDITINGSKTPALKDGIREIVPRYRLGVYRRWVGVLTNAGWCEDDAHEIVRMSAALVTGLGIRTLFDDVDVYLDGTLARWRAMILATWSKTGSSKALLQASRCALHKKDFAMIDPAKPSPNDIDKEPFPSDQIEMLPDEPVAIEVPLEDGDANAQPL